jgi:hypothetical protein
MRKIKIVAVISFVGLLMSFTLLIDSKDVNKVSGAYLGGGPTENPIVKLVLSTDHTFLFKDQSNDDNKIEVTGTWKDHNGSIYLKTEDGEEVKFHDKWKVDSDCNCMKSRKGVTFYRLCK